MKTYTDYVIENKEAKSRAISANNKKQLIDMVYALTGWVAPKSLSQRDIKIAVGL